MTTMNLNLLPSKAKFQAAKIKLQAKIRLVMMVMAIIWVAGVAALLVANFVVRIKANQVKAEGEKIQSNYAAMQENIVSSQRFKYKTKMVGEVLNKRFEYGRAFELVTTLFPASVVVKNYDLREDGNFEIRGEAQGRNNVNEIENIINRVNSGDNEKLTLAVLKNLALKGGVWEFTMEVKLK